MIQHCLEPDPARRYQSGTELQEDIERHLSNCSLKHARERSLAEQVVKWLRRHPAMSSTTSMAVVALISLVLICTASWLVVRDAKKAQARLHYLAFHESFEKAQLLLNTVHDGSRNHLIRGIQLAQTLMNSYLNTGTGDLDSLVPFIPAQRGPTGPSERARGAGHVGGSCPASHWSSKQKQRQGVCKFIIGGSSG